MDLEAGKLEDWKILRTGLENVRMRHKKKSSETRKIVRYMRLLTVLICGIPGAIYLKNLIIESSMPLTGNIYFVAYENKEKPGNTITYKYDVQTRKTSEIGRVPGYFQSCEIDRQKKYTTGVSGYLSSREKQVYFYREEYDGDGI